MSPEVVYFIFCDAVRPDPRNLQRINIDGLVTSMRSTANLPFPVVRPLFVALVVWIGGQGTGDLQLRIIEDRSGSTVFRSRLRQIHFAGDPAAIGGVVFHIRNCSFPDAGLYWGEVLFAGAVIARQRLFLRT